MTISMLPTLPLPLPLPFPVDVLNFVYVKNKAFNHAKSLVKNKGIINLGAGPHRGPFPQAVAESPEVATNVDVMTDGMPNFLQLDLNNPLPFQDKQFDVAFASHVLEHLDNWQMALMEMERVADWVVLVLPHPRSVGGWVHPDHKHHFDFSDMGKMVSDKVFVYC